MLNVAVVGSGPAGLYAAEALVKQAAALPLPAPLRVDVIDRLPTPYGLVRYGVAPDHKSIKSIAQYLRKVLESPDVRFVGGVHLGEDVTRDDLVSAYDAVIYATGAMRDRRLGIPGEDLPGSYAATDFVNWYCGHPDIDSAAFTLDAESVAVIGVGNVAVDVARILARDPAELYATDVPQPVLDALHASKVREVHMIGRRGPAYAKFTTKELRELGELPGVEVVVHADEADLSTFDASGEGLALAESDRRVRGNLVAISKWAQGGVAEAAAPSPSGHARRLVVRFWLKPVEILGTGRVTGVTLERTAIDASGALADTGRCETLNAQMVLRSVGYQSVPLPGVPFDERASVVPNALGRVLGPDGSPLPGEYVAGWLKRGPTGVIGTNKSDAAETVRCLLEDLAGGPGAGDVALPRAGLLRYPDPVDQVGVPAAADVAAGDWPLAAVLAGRGIVPVSYAEWLRIEAAETDLAKALGRGERVKLHNRDAIWSACRPQSDELGDLGAFPVDHRRAAKPDRPPGLAPGPGTGTTGRCRLTCSGGAPGFIIVRQQPRDQGAADARSCREPPGCDARGRRDRQDQHAASPGAMPERKPPGDKPYEIYVTRARSLLIPAGPAVREPAGSDGKTSEGYICRQARTVLGVAVFSGGACH